jgi:membrane protein DedA with SNARE-associated domain
VKGGKLVKQYLGYIIAKYGYIGIFSSLALGVIGLPIPDEVLLTYVGYNVFQGKLSFFIAFLSAFLGASVGISISYALGYKLGFPFLKKFGPKFHITEGRIELTQKLFKKHGSYLLIIGYFIPGVRHVTAYIAGISKMQFQRFMIFAFSGAFIWSITFISLGHELGERWFKVSSYIHRYGIYLFALIILGVFGIITYRKFKETKSTA